MRKPSLSSLGVLVTWLCLTSCASSPGPHDDSDEGDFVDPPGFLAHHTQHLVLSRDAFAHSDQLLHTTADHGFHASFHGTYNQGFRLWKTDHPDAWLDIAVPGSHPQKGIARKDGALVYFPEVLPGVSAAFGARSDQVEEFFLLHSADQLAHLAYQVHFGPAFGKLVQAGEHGEHLYAYDTAGSLLFELPPPVAYDAHDQAWNGTWVVESSEKGKVTVRVKMSLEGASFPVLLDPAFVEPAWTVQTSNVPTARGAAQSASGNGQVLVFGGLDTTGTSLDDALVFDGATWLPGDRTTTSSTRPSARGYGAMVYRTDASASPYTLFGGHTDRANDELWVAALDASNQVTWTQVPRSAAQQADDSLWPTERFLHGMAEDLSSHHVYVAGGVDDAGNLLSDLWEGTLDTSVSPPTVAWTKKCPGCVPGRYGATWVQVKYPAAQAGWFLFGGFDGTSFSNSLSQWNGTSWTALTPSDAAFATQDDGTVLLTGGTSAQLHPPGRYVGFGYSDPSGNLFVGGGVSNDGTSDTWLNDLWVLDRAGGDSRWNRHGQAVGGNLPGARESPVALNVLSSTATGGALVFGGVRDSSVLAQSRLATLTTTTRPVGITAAATALGTATTKYGLANLVAPFSSTSSPPLQMEGYGLKKVSGVWQEIGGGCGSASAPVSVTYCGFTQATSATAPTEYAWVSRDKRYYYQASTGAAPTGSTCVGGDASSETCGVKTAFPTQASTSTVATLVSTLTVGGNQSCRTLAGGGLKCWGSNSGGRLGLSDGVNRGDSSAAGHLMGANLPLVDLGSGRAPVEVKSGTGHTCARLDTNQLKCWGTNGSGQLGQGNTTTRGDSTASGHEMGDYLPTVHLGTSAVVKAIGAGNLHTCVLMDGLDPTTGTTRTNGVKCWGNNGNGQLGQGDTTTRGTTTASMGDALKFVNLGTSAVVKAIGAGNVHTCVLMDGLDPTTGTTRTNGVKCWGRNNFAQLGQGDSTTRGDTAASMGDALKFVNLGTNAVVKALAVGFYHTCVLMDGFDPTTNTTRTNGVKCWGRTVKQNSVRATSTIRGATAASMGNGLKFVNLGTNAVARTIVAGLFHTCVVFDGLDTTTNTAFTNQVKCWGYNGSGQLGIGTNSGNRGTVGDVASEMGNVLRVSLGTGRSALALGVGSSSVHTCALLDNDTVWCWGDNTSGQMGQGDTTDRLSPVGPIAF